MRQTGHPPPPATPTSPVTLGDFLVPDDPRAHRDLADGIALFELMALDARYEDADQAWAHLVVKAQQWRLTPIQAASRLSLAAIHGLAADW